LTSGKPRDCTADGREEAQEAQKGNGFHWRIFKQDLSERWGQKDKGVSFF
jgi:hypothetical protein